MEVKSIEGMRAGINKVVVKLNKLNESIKFGDGTELYLETKYNPAEHTQVIGTVAAVPDKLFFDKTKGEKSMEHETTMDLVVGDKVYMEYFGVMMALGERWDQAATYPEANWFEHNDELYVIIRYEEVFFAVRDDKIVPVNGFCVARPIMAKNLESQEVDLLKDSKKMASRWAEIIYPGKACTAFFDKQYDDRWDLEPGNCVLFGKYSNQRVEYDLHKTLFKEEGEYFVINRKWINFVLPPGWKEDIENAKIK